MGKSWWLISYTYKGETKEYYRKAVSAEQAREIFDSGACVSDPVDQCSNITVTPA